jgi:hypothetical protein
VTSWLKSFVLVAAMIGATLLGPAASAIRVGVLFSVFKSAAISRLVARERYGLAGPVEQARSDADRLDEIRRGGHVREPRRFGAR